MGIINILAHLQGRDLIQIRHKKTAYPWPLAADVIQFCGRKCKHKSWTDLGCRFSSSAGSFAEVRELEAVDEAVTS